VASRRRVIDAGVGCVDVADSVNRDLAATFTGARV
jgi:hypothetical protein